MNRFFAVLLIGLAVGFLASYAVAGTTADVAIERDRSVDRSVDISVCIGDLFRGGPAMHRLPPICYPYRPLYPLPAHRSRDVTRERHYEYRR